jgi:predicted nuclease with RNAse H fold
MTWFGADPGGKGTFGIAKLEADGSFETWCRSSVDEALQLIDGAEAVGIDCPMWWTSGEGGGRRVDAWLRSTYKIPSGTVQSVNSLRGAAVVQGIMLAMRLRKSTPNLPITEAHPKALLKALQLTRVPWTKIAETFDLNEELPQPPNEHCRDALLSAIAAREGARGKWRDLSVEVNRDPGELDPKQLWFGPVSYWWPRG